MFDEVLFPIDNNNNTYKTCVNNNRNKISSIRMRSFSGISLLLPRFPEWTRWRSFGMWTLSSGSSSGGRHIAFGSRRRIWEWLVVIRIGVMTIGSREIDHCRLIVLHRSVSVLRLGVHFSEKDTAPFDTTLNNRIYLLLIGRLLDDQGADETSQLCQQIFLLQRQRRR